MTALHLALVQLDVMDGAAERNLERATALIGRHRGADLYLLPELWTSGYSHAHWAEIADRHTPTAVEAMRGLATARGTAIGGTLVSRAASGGLVNRFWLIDALGAVTTYDKAHLFSPMREPDYLTPGTSRIRAPLGEWTAALSVCFDLRFPEMYRLDALAGADLFLVPAEWPAERGQTMRLLASARAVENQAYLALCNRTGRAEDGTEFTGGSIVVSPNGVVIAAAGAVSGILDAMVDRDHLTNIRGPAPHLSLRRPGVDW